MVAAFITIIKNWVRISQKTAEIEGFIEPRFISSLIHPSNHEHLLFATFFEKFLFLIWK